MLTAIAVPKQAVNDGIQRETNISSRNRSSDQPLVSRNELLEPTSILKSATPIQRRGTIHIRSNTESSTSKESLNKSSNDNLENLFMKHAEQTSELRAISDFNSESPQTDLPTASNIPMETQAENHEMHIGDGDADICEAHLRKECKSGTACFNHHCAMPYLWQIEMCGIWENFENNEEIECEFSQPRNVTALAKCGQVRRICFYVYLLSCFEMVI